MVGTEKEVNTVDTQNQRESTILALPNDGALVAWNSNTQDTDSWGVFMKYVKQCSTHSDCTNEFSAPVCGGDNYCDVCTTDAECLSIFPGTKETCDVAIGRCIECTADSECNDDISSPICELNSNDKVCRGCESDTECQTKNALFPFCDVASGQCHECVNDSDCTDPNEPQCLSN